jgi:hypothetical protein
LNGNKLCIRIHTVGFDHGIHSAFFVGYLGNENPRTADVETLKAGISDAMNEYWRTNTWTDEDCQALVDQFPRMSL